VTEEEEIKVPDTEDKICMTCSAWKSRQDKRFVDYGDCSRYDGLMSHREDTCDFWTSKILLTRRKRKDAKQAEEERASEPYGLGTSTSST